MAELLGIGEFARRAGLSISAVRFYGDRGLLVPIEVDPSTGYRTYGEAQLIEGTFIRDLRRLGFGLTAIAEFLAEPAEGRHKLLDAHLAGLLDDWQQARAVAGEIRRRIDQEEGAMPTVNLPARDLQSAFDGVLVAVGTDLERPILTCLLVESREGSLRVVATDSYRLAIRDVPCSGDGVFRLLVAGPAARRLRDRLAGSGDQSVSVTFDPGALEVTWTGGESMTLAAVEGEFPPYEQLLSAPAAAGELVVDKLLLSRALPEDAAGDQGVILSLERDGVRVEGETDLVPGSYRGEPMEVALHPRFVREALDSTVGPEVAIEVSSSLRRVVFRSATDGSCVHMIMPIRRREIVGA